MAEFNQGTSILGRQVVLTRKTINDVAYFRVLGVAQEPKRRLGTLWFLVDFGEEANTMRYLQSEVRLWNQSIAWYPAFETRLGVQWTIFADWKVPGISWNLNTY